MKTAIQVVLAVAIIVLGYLLWESINKPIRFNREKDRIEQATIQRLKDIRTAQLAYRSEHGRFTGDFDSLITFLKTDSFSVVQAIGSVPDSMIEEYGNRKKAELQALKEGLISRDTIRLSVKDSLFQPGYYIDSLRYAPYTKGYQFELGAGTLEAGKVAVRVFEAKVPYDILLSGLDRQLIINYKETREKITGYPGLRVGSLEEATNNAGNWE
jgi:hypothetical protein